MREERVCWTLGSKVHVLSAKTGEPVWERTMDEEGDLSCPVAQGRDLYVVSGEAMHCLDVASGATSWTVRLADTVGGLQRPLLAVDGARAYFVQTRPGAGSRLCCMGLESRQLLWTRPVGPARWLLAAGSGVYLRGERVLALDRLSGERLWECEVAGCGPLTTLGGLVCFVDSSRAGRLVAVDPRTGEQTWELPGIRSCDAFTRAGDTGYIKTADGVVHALALADLGRS